MAYLGKNHWNAIKWILRYFKGTCSHGLLYENRGCTKGKLIGYVDADYAADLDRRRSISGYVFTPNNNISWKSTFQTIVALSTTEA